VTTRLVDYQKRIEQISDTAEARLLRLEIMTAVDNYARLFKRHGLEVHISWEKDTRPDNPDAVVFNDWDSVRQGNKH
jgi:hypothetical protein